METESLKAQAPGKPGHYASYPPVRALTRKDRKKLSELIKAFADKSGNDKLTSMIPSVSASSALSNKDDAETPVKNEEVYTLIKSVLEGLLRWVEDDVNAWFMDLLGIKEQAEYDTLGFDIEIYVIDSLIAQKGFNNFFTRASELYKKIRG